MGARATTVAALSVISVCALTVTAWAVTRSPQEPIDERSAVVSSAVSATRTARPTRTQTPTLTQTPTQTPTSSAGRRTPTKASSPTPSSRAAPKTSNDRTAPATSGGSSSGSSSSARSVGRLFAADSPWNTRVPAGAALDPQSAAISRAVLTKQSLVVNVAIYAYGIPFYTATASTPRVVLGGRGSTGARIPLDPSWAPNDGGDHKMNVLDPATRSVYELQYYDQDGRSAYWMVKRDTATGSGDGTASGGRSGPTGSGMTQAGGVIRIAELKAGRIDHALSFITSAPLAGTYRYPATSTDGTSTAPVGMEEGMRVQLDPTLDLGALRLSKAEYAIARALQQYGAYCVDNGGGNNQAMGFYAESPTRSTGDPYASLGLVGDWAQLKGIPRSAYRVLAASVTRR